MIEDRTDDYEEGRRAGYAECEADLVAYFCRKADALAALPTEKALSAIFYCRMTIASIEAGEHRLHAADWEVPDGR